MYLALSLLPIVETSVSYFGTTEASSPSPATQYPSRSSPRPAKPADQILLSRNCNFNFSQTLGLQIVNLNYMLSKSSVNARPNVLRCYKDKLELSSHRKKRAKQVKKLLQRGLLDPEKVDPFSLFVESGNITYCLYEDSEMVLGNTFGMCILQDFEAVTPNLLATTIETVAGSGLVILLLRSL